jgi:hypothetical protein
MNFEVSVSIELSVDDAGQIGEGSRPKIHFVFVTFPDARLLYISTTFGVMSTPWSL